MAKESAYKMDFCGGLLKAFKERYQVDVWLKAGDQTEAIPAHKLILAARSKVFWNILEPDEFKASTNETVTLSELTYDELETFLEFMYTGSLPDTKLVQHVRTLYTAADKYEVPYLQELCRNHLIDSMNSQDVLDILDLAEIHSDQILTCAASEFFTTHMEDISFSSKFLSFVESNPALTVQAIRGYVNKTKNDHRPKTLPTPSTVPQNHFYRTSLFSTPFGSGQFSKSFVQNLAKQQQAAVANVCDLVLADFY